MGSLLFFLLFALVVAVVVLVYVAFPYRGEETPGHPAVGRLMRRGVRALPTVAPDEAGRTPSRR